MKDDKIVFVTTTLNTKWFSYQSDIIRKLFPKSGHVVIDGGTRWPNVWFDWIDVVKKMDYSYYIHIDEDFFILNKEEIIKCIKKMEDEHIDLLGCSDGWNHYRKHNPVAINSFFMIGRVEHLKNLDFKDIQFGYSDNSYINNYNLYYKPEFGDNSEYKFTKTNTHIFDNFEPYYTFQWKLKEMGCKFDYLYPHFDDRFKSTNPRINEDSDDIGVHMWYTRECDSNLDVFGVPNKERYKAVEKMLLLKYHSI